MGRTSGSVGVMVKDEERGEEVAGWGCDIKGGRLANGMTAGWQPEKKRTSSLFPLAYPFCDVSVCSKFNAKAAATASMPWLTLSISS
jgi:hypothetical protein